MLDLVKIIQNGGATLDRNGNAIEFKSGYQVSKKDCFVFTVGNAKKIVRAVNKILKGLTADEFCGIWIDGGRAYVDISERIRDRRAALKVGRERKQISIFDWRAGACVYC